ncbi:MAG: carboxylesterase/lipase family protein [Acidobacteriota bacterium]|nr:carboxylesterase/lipase family protein [Acidobacteriota bacterium]
MKRLGWSTGWIILWSVSLLALAAFSAGAAKEPPAQAGSFTNTVNTTNGPVRGRIEQTGVNVFKGIRYGAPPVGPNRFKPPRKPAAWTVVADAAEYGSRAMQAAGGPGAAGDGIKMSEDCLFLNVWTPGLDGKKRPVMVWLHGGGFSSGSGGEAITEGGNLARKGDVVVVSMNHRLNVFGFLQLSEAWGADYAASGQAGMLDIVLSLEWVRDNIARFGGDPGNVTIFGESGGGRKVAMLMAMPPAKGLFHKAIVQSGAGLDAPDKSDAVALGRELLKKLGIAENDVAALMKTDAKAVFDAQPPGSASASMPGNLIMPLSGFVPCVDGVALPRKPFVPDAPAISAQIPLLIGSNKDEMTIFKPPTPKLEASTDEDFAAYVRSQLPDKAEAFIPALRAAFPGYSPYHLMAATDTMKGYWIATVLQAERKAMQKGAPVYVYQLAWETPVNGGRLRAHHALDLPLVFDNVGNGRSMVGPGSEPQQLADRMGSAWIAFARTGNPNTEGLPQWPEYDTARRATMIFDTNSRVVYDPYAEIRRILVK